MRHKRKDNVAKKPRSFQRGFIDWGVAAIIYMVVLGCSGAIGVAGFSAGMSFWK